MKKIIFTGGSGKFGKIFKKFEFKVDQIFIILHQKFSTLQTLKNGKVY